MNSVYTDLRKEYISEWRVWYKMIYSCENKQKYYLETSVCDEWQGEQGFVTWFDYLGPRPSQHHVLDRINKLGDYEPGNVEWTTKSTSQQRQRFHLDPNNLLITARRNGIKGACYYARLRRGWDPIDAATLPSRKDKYRNRLT